LNLRDPAGEAVSTYRELVAKNHNWSLDVLVRDAGRARVLADELAALSVVDGIVTIDDFVPVDQQQALDEIADLALLLGPELDGQRRAASAASSAVPALTRLRAALAESSTAVEQLRLADSLDALLEKLARLDESSRSSLLNRLQMAVTGTLPGELSRLAHALDASPVSRDSLPETLLADWQAADGRLRIRIDSRDDLNQREALVEFVTRVQAVAPNAVGAPIVHLESSRVVVLAFVQALGVALICIVVILYFALRRLVDVVIVLSPLVLAILISVAVMVGLDLPFNFANVIALPLLLGVGVDSGIHMLTRARWADDGGSLMLSSTARGVVISALTTTVSFGNLAFSQHPGTASMGLLLTVGMIATLLATLLVLPAMVRLMDNSTATEVS
jgi:predicted RND superfamily exporter protein